MVTCRLYGGLGNQMYQIAATIAHAKRNGYLYRIPPQTSDPVKWPNHPFSHLPDRLNVGMINIYQEQGHQFTPIPPRDNIILDGYFQSYKYFEDFMDYIRLAFRVPLHVNKGILGIHVRGGDYRGQEEYHPILPMEYYSKALGEFSKNKIRQIVVYTNDKELAGKYFPHYDQSTSVNPIDDLLSMAMCEHLIVGNSSFSVMAALLNRNPKKKIIAINRKRYFGPGYNDLSVRDIYPEYFKEIEL